MHSGPYLLLDEIKCKRNIEQIVQKAQKHGLAFRPHFKTHQSIYVGRWFRDFGVNSITVSSVQMAEYFASDGWDDITIAFPLSSLQIDAVNTLAEKIHLNIIFSSAANLIKSIGAIKSAIGVFIEVDVGYGRSGVNSDNMREIALMVKLISENTMLTFKGFLTHAGQTYKAHSSAEVISIHQSALGQLVKLKSFWKSSYSNIIISYGDTPSCSIADEFWGVDEIRPGNLVFYDIMQNQIGSCSIDSIAVAMICPVVDVYPNRNEAIVHCGAVHLSKDSIVLPSGNLSYGTVCSFDGKSWGEPIPDLYVKSVSQEHGIIGSVQDSGIIPLGVGDMIAILPIHSCLTVDCMGVMYFPNGTKISTMRERTAL